MVKTIDFKRAVRSKKIADGIKRSKVQKAEVEAKIARGESPLLPAAAQAILSMMDLIEIDENGRAVPKKRGFKLGGSTKGPV